MKTSEQINEIAKALAQAQGEMTPASKSSTNPHFKSKYADFASIWESIRVPLKKHELTVLQDVNTSDNGVAILTRLIHSSGQWIECGPLEIPLNRRDAQAVGSAITYGKRYALSAAVGISCDDDDDAEGAMNRKKQLSDVITKEQVNELNAIFFECDPEYIKKVWNNLKKPPLSIETIAQLPAAMYERVKTAALKNSHEFKSNALKSNEVTHAA